MKIKGYAAYHIEGSKADEFKKEAMKLFGNPELKEQLQWRMVNLNRETMSFDLDVRQNCPEEILEIGKKLGTGINSFA